MLSSKANAALTRLKEIEEKYKMKRKQQKWNHKGDSSISSVSMDLSEGLSVTLKESPKRVIKPKLNVKMPDTRFVDEKATNQIDLKSFEDKINPNVTSLRNKLQEDRRQANLSSDTTTIHEKNSSISSTSVDLAKLVSRSKKLQDAVSNKIPGRESKTKARETKIKTEKISDKSSETSSGRTSLDGSSSTVKRSRMSKRSSNISKSSSDPTSKDGQLKMAAIAESSPETAGFPQKSHSHSNHTESPNDNSIIEESIDTTINGSEIISELSWVDDENIAVKVEDFTSIPRNSEHLETENASVTIVRSSKHLLVESGYANDTFEDVSISTARSKSKFQEAEEATDKDDYKNDNFENEKGDLTLKSIVTEMDLETSASDLDKIITDPDSTATYSIKPLNSTDSSLKEKREHSQQRSKFKESVPNDNSATNLNSITSHENISSSEETDTKVVFSREKENPPTSESEINQKQENDRQEQSSGKTFPDGKEVEKRVTMDVTESMSSHSSKKMENKDVANEDVPDEDAKERISRNIDDALEKLRRDMIEAISKRHVNSGTVKNVPARDLPESEAKFEVEKTMTRILTTKMEDERCRHSVKNQKIFDKRNNDYERKKRSRARVTNTKSVKAHGSTKSKGGKTLNLDEKQMHILRKRIMELRLRQEWEDLQKYLRELKGLRAKSPATRNYFSPLEFPKIAEFTFGLQYSESKSDDYAVFRQRVLAIKQRLKDQYILYRDYCTMAQAINAHYVPTTLEDAKKMMYKSRKITVKIR